VFDGQKLLSRDGRSGPALLSLHARIGAIGRDAGFDIEQGSGKCPRVLTLQHPVELALAKSLYRRGWERGDILELFRFIDWMLRLPEELEEQLWSEIQTYETVEHMPYVTSVERIGIRKGIRQGIEQATPEGLQHQRHMLTRQVQWRFGTDVAKDSRLLLADIADPQRLDDLAEVVLDSPDGACWLRVRRLLRERPEFDVAKRSTLL
jgi:hypothetical protein